MEDGLYLHTGPGVRGGGVEKGWVRDGWGTVSYRGIPGYGSVSVDKCKRPQRYITSYFVGLQDIEGKRLLS